MSVRLRLIKNAVANLGRGGASGIAALLLPPLLVRHMSAASYGVWVLVLQVAAYISYLDFGLQTAVGRYVAYTTEKNDAAQRNSIFSTAFTALSAAAALGIILLLIAAAAVRPLFPAIPPDFISPMRQALMILGISLALGLPASAWNGVFIGIQRNEIPALTTGVARLASAAGVVLAAFAGKSVVVMAVIMAAANLVSYALQYAVMRKVVPEIEFDLKLVRRSSISELLGYCFGLTVMSFSMLLITGLDLILVGRLQFSAVTPYSVAASMIAFITGVLSAILNALMPHAAGIHAREDPMALGRLVVITTQLATILLVFTGLPLMIYAAPILKAWIGKPYVEAGYPILVVLLIANIIRLLGIPYAIILVSAGQQQFIKISPITEGLTNLVASLVLGSMFGAIGVALGTLVGSFFAIAAHLFYSMPRTNRVMSFSRRHYVSSGMIAPFLATTPLLLVAIFSVVHGPATIHPTILLAAAALSIPGSILLLRRSGILPEGGFRFAGSSASK